MAARPMPGASYMVSNMSSLSLRSSTVIFSTGFDTSRNRLSGKVIISRLAMAAGCNLWVNGGQLDAQDLFTRH